MTMRELTEALGVAQRQVRFMLAEGFASAPAGGRAHAPCGEQHVNAVRGYYGLQELGFAPPSIRVLLQGRLSLWNLG